MKTIRILSVFAAVTALTGAALAHGPGGGRMFEKMDTNSDGKVTLAEAQAGSQAHFTALDKNKDGAITANELEGKKGRMLKHADANNDGKVTLAELQAEGQKWFARIDKNNDKVITKEEVQALRAEHGGGNCHKS
jgi:Ca2+-binding EF-hand superfamily protein